MIPMVVIIIILYACLLGGISVCMCVEGCGGEVSVWITCIG